MTVTNAGCGVLVFSDDDDVGVIVGYARYVANGYNGFFARPHRKDDVFPVGDCDPSRLESSLFGSCNRDVFGC